VSTWEHLPAQCPACANDFDVPVLKGLHVTRLPEVRTDILEGRFQQHVCPSCGTRIQLESTSVYTDFDNWHYVGIEAPSPSSWSEARKRHVDAFDANFILGPPAAQELAHAMVHRVVFGMHALREKLLVWDAGLDDKVVEAMKGDHLRRRGIDVRDEVLRVSAVLDGGHLLLARLSRWPLVDVDDNGVTTLPLPELRGHVTFLFDDYQRMLMNQVDILGNYPWLNDNWVRDIHVAAPAR